MTIPTSPSPGTNAIDVGYVGLDHHHAEPYLATLAQLPVDVTCACEPNEQIGTDAVAGLDDVPLYRSVEALLDAETPDLLWVTASNAATLDVVTGAAERGVDVFTEKPVARTAADLRPVIETVDASDASVGISYAWRGHPIAMELRNRADAGFFGDVRSFETRFLSSKPAFRDPEHYLFDPTASRGGIVQWLGVHWVDLLPWILDDPIERVDAVLDSHSDAIGVEDAAQVRFETASGAVGSLHCEYTLREGQYDTNVAIYGEEGRAQWDPIGATFGFDGETELELASTTDDWNGAPTRTITYEYEACPGYGGAWGVHFFASFLDAFASDDRVPVSLDDALAVLEVLDAVYESADTEGWVTVGQGAE